MKEYNNNSAQLSQLRKTIEENLKFVKNCGESYTELKEVSKETELKESFVNPIGEFFQ